MAYLDLSVGAPQVSVPLLAAPVQKLSAQERLVVMLSRRDPLWSLKPRGTIARVASFLFGIEPPHQLADPRLETLRRYAVTYRVRGDDAEAAEAAREAGFADSQLSQLRQIVGNSHAAVHRSSVGGAIALLVLLTALLLAGATTRWLTPRLDSSLLSLVVIGLFAVSLAPFLAGSGRGARA
jgi:hypothetical protein